MSDREDREKTRERKRSGSNNSKRSDRQHELKKSHSRERDNQGHRKKSHSRERNGSKERDHKKVLISFRFHFISFKNVY
jgi:hypothetical protein